MTSPYEVYVNLDLRSGIFQIQEEIEKSVRNYLKYLYNCIETIKLNFKEYEKLSINYEALDCGLYIQMYKKIIYSSYEEERYRQELKEKLKKGYNDLYKKNISPILDLCLKFLSIIWHLHFFQP